MVEVSREPLKPETVRNKELDSLFGLGMWGLQECMQILKLPFIKLYTLNWGKCVS